MSTEILFYGEANGNHLLEAVSGFQVIYGAVIEIDPLGLEP